MSKNKKEMFIIGNIWDTGCLETIDSFRTLTEAEKSINERLPENPDETFFVAKVITEYTMELSVIKTDVK